MEGEKRPFERNLWRRVVWLRNELLAFYVDGRGKEEGGAGRGRRAAGVERLSSRASVRVLTIIKR